VTLVEKYVCQLSQPRTSISQVKHLRWQMFRKNQAQSDRLPHTQSALYEAILRAHYQMLVWNNDRVCIPNLPKPDGFGWEKEGDEWIPVMTKQAPAPQAIIQLVKCGCQKNRCSNNRCQCRKSGLNCTDLCSCCDSAEACENVYEDIDTSLKIEYDDSDSDE